jgi:energy-coupling factor transporter transmembrane protein EcfT
MIIFQKPRKAFFQRIIEALIQNPLLYISIWIALGVFFMEKTIPFSSAFVILPFLLVAAIHSIFVSKTAIQEISISEDEIEINYLHMNKVRLIKPRKNQLTFLDINDRYQTKILFFINSNKILVQHFSGQYKHSEFESLRHRLAELNILKPYGYNL